MTNTFEKFSGVWGNSRFLPRPTPTRRAPTIRLRGKLPPPPTHELCQVRCWSLRELFRLITAKILMNFNFGECVKIVKLHTTHIINFSQNFLLFIEFFKKIRGKSNQFSHGSWLRGGPSQTLSPGVRPCPYMRTRALKPTSSPEFAACGRSLLRMPYYNN